MNISPKETDLIKQLNDDILRLQNELKQEKTLREEVENQYLLLGNQYQQAINYINKSQRRVTSHDDGCLFLFFVIFILSMFIVSLFKNS
jgi:hypothetical protein